MTATLDRDHALLQERGPVTGDGQGADQGPGLPPGRRTRQGRGTDLPAAVAERVREPFARADPELREDLAQVPLDGPGADEQLSTDLGIGQAVASQASDVLLLCGQ